MFILFSISRGTGKYPDKKSKFDILFSSDKLKGNYFFSAEFMKTDGLFAQDDTRSVVFSHKPYVSSHYIKYISWEDLFGYNKI